MVKLKALTFAFVILLVSGCRTTPPTDIPTGTQPQAPSLDQLQKRLGLGRVPDDLGFAEKTFDTCEQGFTVTDCRRRVFTVVHFQLLCRDSEGTVQEVPTTLKPLQTGRLTWRLAGRSGATKTDREGFGQLQVLSDRTLKGQRLTLRIGKQFMGFTASDLTKVVLPMGFCS